MSVRLAPRLACACALSLTLGTLILACAPAPEDGGATAADDTADRAGADTGARAAAAAGEAAATWEGVEAAFQEFIAAWESEDVDAVVGMFTDDGVAFDPVPPGKFSGSEEIRELASSTFEAMDRISIPVGEVEIETHGPVAWSTARYTFQSEVGGQPTSDEGYVSIVWVRQDDGSYKAALFHASPLPTEGPETGAS